MKQRGMTLIELMVVVGISVILVVAVAVAYDAGIQFQQRVPEQDTEMRRMIQFEERVRTILEGAYLTTDATDDTSYFSAISTSGNLAEPDTLVFTTLGLPPTSAYLRTSDETFEESNEKFGPQGGLAEVSFSTIPVGDAPVENALFLRIQRPADGDETQGGYERAMLENVEYFNFEFFDGIEWVTEWDTFTGQRRLPASVRIRYRMLDEDYERILTVRLPHSDVTPENPLTQEIAQ